MRQENFTLISRETAALCRIFEQVCRVQPNKRGEKHCTDQIPASSTEMTRCSSRALMSSRTRRCVTTIIDEVCRPALPLIGEPQQLKQTHHVEASCFMARPQNKRETLAIACNWPSAILKTYSKKMSADLLEFIWEIHEKMS